MNLIQKLEHEQMLKLSDGKVIPSFRAGDNVRVHVKVVEGERTRTQSYEGICIARKNRGLRSTFRVRKMSSGEGVERVFQLYSPNISVEVVRFGRVRRSKLYYLRQLTGKAARIAELKKPRVVAESSAKVALKSKKAETTETPASAE